MNGRKYLGTGQDEILILIRSDKKGTRINIHDPVGTVNYFDFVFRWRETVATKPVSIG